MEKLEFKQTMSWTKYKQVMGDDTKTFWSYTSKRDGTKGWMSSTKIGDEEFPISVSKKLVPAFNAHTVDKPMDTSRLQVSTVEWPDGTTGTILHLPGENNVII